MEKTKNSKVEPHTFSDELVIIKELLGTYRKKLNAEDKRSDSHKSNHLTLIIAVVLLLIIAILYIAEHYLPHTVWRESTESIQLMLRLFVLLTYIITSATVLFQYLSRKDFYRDFTGKVIAYSADASEYEAELFEGLSELSTESINFVTNRLEKMLIQLAQKRVFLVEVIDKTGITLGLLATLTAIYNATNATSFFWYELLSFSMIVIYLSMFVITELSIKIKRISISLNQYTLMLRHNSTN